MLKLLANEGILRRIVESAAAAPSIHNTQPWQFTVASDDLLEVRADLGRALWVSDPRAMALYLSCGAAVFNNITAIRMTGFNPRVWPLPQPEFPPTVMRLSRQNRVGRRHSANAKCTRRSGTGTPTATRSLPSQSLSPCARLWGRRPGWSSRPCGC